MFVLKIPKTNIEIGLSLIAIMIGAILIHEIGLFFLFFVFTFSHEMMHYLVAKGCHYKISKVKLKIWGGALEMDDYLIKPSHEMLILIVGPLFNLIMALIVIILQIKWSHPILEEILFINLSLGIFNLIPIAPLDGGKIIRLYLSYFIGYGKAIKISLFISKIFAILLIIAGVYLLNYDFSYIIMCLVGMNIYVASQVESNFLFYKIVRYMENNEVKTDTIVVCREHKNIKHAMDTFSPGKSRRFTIVNEKGQYKGQLSENDILKGLFNHGLYTDYSKLLDAKNMKGSK
ncbi:MAG: site-2 protease family protein [Peptostreptococcales bacterium]|jgi:stage IV sporulation protein FB